MDHDIERSLNRLDVRCGDGQVVFRSEYVDPFRRLELVCAAEVDPLLTFSLHFRNVDLLRDFTCRSPLLFSPLALEIASVDLLSDGVPLEILHIDPLRD